jgi:PhnB protein
MFVLAVTLPRLVAMTGWPRPRRACTPPASPRFHHGYSTRRAELLRNRLPDGRVLFVELAVGPARLLLSEETPSLGALAPPTIGGTPVLLHVEVADPDAAAGQAVDAGAQVEIPVQEMFWGERYGVLRDPFGHRWSISTAREQFTPDDIARHTPPDV